MKVGEYVRITNGQIAKITKIKEYKKWSNIIYTDIAIDMNEDRAWNENQIDEEDVIKSSPNIIDLIEPGDYVNGSKVLDIISAPTKAIYTEQETGGALLPIVNNHIESILTKEQFENMEYRIGE